MAKVETLMLANHAETLNGLLYLHGGGWSHHWRHAPEPGQPPAPSQFAIAATFLLDPPESGGRQPFVLRVASGKGEEILRADGALESGSRPAPSIGESRFRAAVALNANVLFPHEGIYKLTAEIGGRSGPAVDFWVHDQPPPDAARSTNEPGSGTATTGYL